MIFCCTGARNIISVAIACAMAAERILYEAGGLAEKASVRNPI